MTVSVPWVIAVLAFAFLMMAIYDYLTRDGAPPLKAKARLRMGLILAAVATYLLLH
ncbi:MAG: hypothetical protein AAGI72_20450 [Pseudomonadota bacterium]